MTITALLTTAAAKFGGWRDVTRVIAKVIVGSRSHVDYDGFVDHGCCHFGVWGDVTVILLFFGPPLSTREGGGKGDR